MNGGFIKRGSFASATKKLSSNNNRSTNIFNNQITSESYAIFYNRFIPLSMKRGVSILELLRRVK